MELVEVVPEQTLTLGNEIQQAEVNFALDTPINAGDLFIVNYNGIDYLCEAKYSETITDPDGNIAAETVEVVKEFYLGNPAVINEIFGEVVFTEDTGEPFFLGQTGTHFYLIANETNDITLSVKRITGEYVKIPSNYIPSESELAFTLEGSWGIGNTADDLTITANKSALEIYQTPIEKLVSAKIYTTNSLANFCFNVISVFKEVDTVFFLVDLWVWLIRRDYVISVSSDGTIEITRFEDLNFD